MSEETATQTANPAPVTDSPAIAEARAVLAEMAEGMRAIELRASCLAERLRQAATTAEVIGYEDNEGTQGDPITVEGWLAGALSDDLRHVSGDSWSATSLAEMAAHDWRAEVVNVVMGAQQERDKTALLFKLYDEAMYQDASDWEVSRSRLRELVGAVLDAPVCGEELRGFAHQLGVGVDELLRVCGLQIETTKIARFIERDRANDQAVE